METAPWFIHKLPDGSCEVDQHPEAETPTLKTWGPFTEQGEALAKRVGLIRSGQCLPRQPVQKED